MKRNISFLCCLLWLGPVAFGQLVFQDKVVEKTAGLDQKQVLADFRFQNLGPYTITISNLLSSCGCTTATLQDKTILSGSSGVVHVTFNVGNRRGPQHKTIGVATDDPTHSDTTLRLDVSIPEAIHIEPLFVHWQIGDAPNPQVITVKAGSAGPVHVLGVKSNNPALSTVLKTLKDGSEYSIEVQPADTKEHRNAVLQIQTDLKPPRDLIKVYAQVQP